MSDVPADREFTPISPNPFIVGNPVRGRSMFFGREAEFDLVRRSFQRSSRGVLLVFCGERRSGKTSILFQILDRRLGPDFIPVLIDMQSMAVRDEIEFLTRISADVMDAAAPDAKDLAPPRFAPDTNNAAIFQKFIQDVMRAHPGKKLILLFDEYELFENKIDSGQLDQQVLHILANLMENEPVFLIFTGSQHIEQRRREYWKILAKAPLFKMISFLEREDALSLIRKPVEGRVRYAEGTIEAIYRLSAGQPFYTQAICQSLVDQLNERGKNHATADLVAEVVDGIVNNPLPQMIFLWDGLERDEKLVLSLLAEALVDGSSSAAGADLARLLRERQYPLALDRAQIASTLETLFKGEMLLRRDQGNQLAYAFRMDLWRLWIRRQHSFWQVLRELGIDFRTRGIRALVIRWAVAGGVAVAAVAIAMSWLATRRDGTGAPVPNRADSLLAHQDPSSQAMPPLAPARIPLGDLHIVTQPPGAEIKVEGIRKGPSPVTVKVTASIPLTVEASLVGYITERREVSVQSDTLMPMEMILAPAPVSVLVSSQPSNSEIWLDGTRRGLAPLPLAILPGEHRLVASLPGHTRVDTMLIVRHGTDRFHFELNPEPPGFIVVRGGRPAARILIDGQIVKTDINNTGPRQARAGTHQIEVILAPGNKVDTSVVVSPGDTVTYDFSTGTVTRTRGGRP